MKNLQKSVSVFTHGEKQRRFFVYTYWYNYICVLKKSMVTPIFCGKQKIQGVFKLLKEKVEDALTSRAARRHDILVILPSFP